MYVAQMMGKQLTLGQSISSSIVKSCSIVGTTLDMNFRKKKRLFSTRGSPPLLWIYSIIFFITVAWLQG